ncbi:P-loop containing nucleoside triphosphate hydrolase protein, partial [Pseudomassariella vexata]
PDLEPVLKGILIYMEPQQHIAICGRSSSGKSSLVLCLLKMFDTQAGHISIDGVDTESFPCAEARSHINLVPQDTFLLPGTV